MTRFDQCVVVFACCAGRGRVAARHGRARAAARRTVAGRAGRTRRRRRARRHSAAPQRFVLALQHGVLLDEERNRRGRCGERTGRPGQRRCRCARRRRRRRQVEMHHTAVCKINYAVRRRGFRQAGARGMTRAAVGGGGVAARWRRRSVRYIVWRRYEVCAHPSHERRHRQHFAQLVVAKRLCQRTVQQQRVTRLSRYVRSFTARTLIIIIIIIVVIIISFFGVVIIFLIVVRRDNELDKHRQSDNVTTRIQCRQAVRATSKRLERSRTHAIAEHATDATVCGHGQHVDVPLQHLLGTPAEQQLGAAVEACDVERVVECNGGSDVVRRRRRVGGGGGARGRRRRVRVRCGGARHARHLLRRA